MNEHEPLRPLTLMEIQNALQEIVRVLESPATGYKFTDFRECTDYIRVLAKYVVFDNECLRREKKTLETLNGSKGEQDKSGDDAV
jgi:hypothetical protein